jgi:hypothetical protein
MTNQDQLPNPMFNRTLLSVKIGDVITSVIATIYVATLRCYNRRKARRKRTCLQLPALALTASRLSQDK